MSDFRTSTLALVAFDLDGPHVQDDDFRDKILHLLGEEFTEAQLLTLEETFSNLSDRCYTSRRRTKAAREARERVAGMTDEAILAAREQRLAAVPPPSTWKPMLRLVGGGAA